MIAGIVFGLYRLILPLLFLVAFPAWVLKMIKRGGFATALFERVGIYGRKESHPSGAIHLHAISVGESLLAIKLLKAWRKIDPDARFVIAVGTATGHIMASQAQIPGLHVCYAPLDFAWMIRNYFHRFQPERVVLIEGEIWPNFLRFAEKRGIRVDLANARTSPRSARRLARFAKLLQPFYSKLSSVCIQEEEHRSLWFALGVSAEKIHRTGSLKFDPESTAAPSSNPVFQEMLDAFGEGRRVVLAASTFPGEEEWLAKNLWNFDPRILPVMVPRHAERRKEVSQALLRSGFSVTLRSHFSPPNKKDKAVFLIDTTGELATWICHADVVIIGKSFFAKGGQNPAEAILAGKPLIFGPYMENFQPLANRLLVENAACRAENETSLEQALQKTFDPHKAAALIHNAKQVLSAHAGATERHLSVLQVSKTSA